MRFIKSLVVVALMMGDLHLHAQEFGVEYTTELQTNYRECNFVNLLHLNAEMSISKSVKIGASTISIAKTREKRLVDDLQNFSNIEEDNLPLAIAVCGANWQINDKHSLFVGIRNMNEDYFTSPVTSFFTNSSCGIYPTISSNYPMANYPVASVGMHYQYTTENIGIKFSLYSGTGYNEFSGHDNVFRFCPKEDGILILNEFQYHNNGDTFFAGNALYSSGITCATPWLYVERQVRHGINLIACYSHAFGHNLACRDFAGLGLHYRYAKYELGFFYRLCKI